MGEVTWHCERCLFLYGKVYSWCSLEMPFLYSYFCIGPKHFFNIMHFVCMASHITCTFCSEFCINCHVYMSMCFTVCNFYILFCVGILGGNCGWSDMAWQMNLSQLTAGYSYMFMRWTLVLWWNMMGNSHVFEMFWS